MSFNSSQNGRGFEAGYFLVNNEECTRITYQIAQNHAAVITTADNRKIVPAGAVIPSNNSSAVGILYEDIDVTTGDMPGSIVTRGEIYGDRLPAALDSDAATAMTGIKVTSSVPAIKRPASFTKKTLDTITVTSAQGTGSGKTDVSLSGYTPGSDERYAYKIAQTTAPAAHLGEVIPVSGSGAWTVATFPLDELTATDGYKIAVVSIDSINAVVAYGSTEIDSHA